MLLGVEDGASAGADGDGRGRSAWDGDLRRVKMLAWREPALGVAAVMVESGGDVIGWLNLAHVRQDEAFLAWYWIRHAAWHRPPFDVLTAADLAGFRQELAIAV